MKIRELIAIAIIVILAAVITVAYGQDTTTPKPARDLKPIDLNMVQNVLTQKDAEISGLLLAREQANATIDDLSKQLADLKSKPCTPPATDDKQPKPKP